MANQILTLFFGKGLVHLGPMGVVESELGVLKCYIRLEFSLQALHLGSKE